MKATDLARPKGDEEVFFSPLLEMTNLLGRRTSASGDGFSSEHRHLDEVRRRTVLSAIARSEIATLRRVCISWDELKRWCNIEGIPRHNISSESLGSFIHASTAPARAHVSLAWGRKNLDLLLPPVKNAPMPQRPNAYGEGSRQAAAVTPAMVYALDFAVSELIKQQDGADQGRLSS